MDNIKSAFNHQNPESFSGYEDCIHHLDLSIKNNSRKDDEKQELVLDETAKRSTNIQQEGSSASSTCTHEPRYDALSTNFIREFSENSSKFKKSLATLLVVPSHDVDTFVRILTPSSAAKYEERQLYNLLLLRDNPNLRIIYVSSEMFSEDVIGYYLRLGNNKDSWRDQLSRLCMLSVNDSSFPGTLSQKILERPQLLSQIHELIFRKPSDISVCTVNAARKNLNEHYVGLSVYTGSASCSRLSHVLGLPLLEAEQRHLHWGTKQGSREIFYASRVPFPRGTPDVDCGDYDTLLTPLTNDSKSSVGDNEEFYNWEKEMRYIRSPRALSIGLARQIMLKNVRPQRWMIKLNQGSCGRCNATLNLTELQNDPRYQVCKLSENHKAALDLRDLQSGPRYQVTQETIASSTDETSLVNGIVNEKINDLALDIERRLPLMQFNDPSLTWDTPSDDDHHSGFRSQMYRLGAIAEELIEFDCPFIKFGEKEISIRSPSFQGVITVNDKACECDRYFHCSSVHVVSTHEQVLKGLIFVGCEMPAAEAYRKNLIEYGLKIGSQLADRGVVGHFSVDFLAIPRLVVDGSKEEIEWDMVAVEINLRQGGTTHPHAAMEILVGGGSIDELDGSFKTREGNNSRYYVATDGFKDPLLKNLSDSDLICAIESENDPDAKRLHWDQSRKVGTVFHLFRALKSDGRVGFTCIGATEEEAKSMFNSTIRFITLLAAKKSNVTASLA